MAISRVYQAVDFHCGANLVLNEGASHHLSRVLRAGLGDEITLFNGQGGEYTAEIVNIQKKHVTVLVKSFHDREVESPLHITLAQGLARGEKMDFIIQKACELGVNEIQPLVTTRCNVKLEGEREEKRLLHWQAVIESACEQCGRNRLPVIHAPKTVSAWLKVCNARLKVVLSPSAASPFDSQSATPYRDVALLIGSEGGFSDEEVKAAVDSGFVAMTLGPRILRTETATVAAVSVVQALMGDLI